MLETLTVAHHHKLEDLRSFMGEQIYGQIPERVLTPCHLSPRFLTLRYWFRVHGFLIGLLCATTGC